MSKFEVDTMKKIYFQKIVCDSCFNKENFGEFEVLPIQVEWLEAFMVYFSLSEA